MIHANAVAATLSVALLAPGAPFRVLPEQPPTTIRVGNHTISIPEHASAASCSQGFNGTINGQLVMLTAGHCFDLSEGVDNEPTDVMRTHRVEVSIDASYRPIGTPTNLKPSTDYADVYLPSQFFWDTVNTPDWGVVTAAPDTPATRMSFSRDANGHAHGAPRELRYIQDTRNLPYNYFDTSNFGQPICKDGATTGRTCGHQLARSRNSIYSWGLRYEHGDSGGINYDPRDGAVLGVSSMGIGPLGKAQRADRIIEDAFNVPDGKVNEAFTLPDSTAPHGNFTPLNQEQGALMHQIMQDNPELKPRKTGKQGFDEAVTAAQRDAEVAAQRAGQVRTVEQAQRLAADVSGAVDHHAQQLGKWGAITAVETLGTASLN